MLLLCEVTLDRIHVTSEVSYRPPSLLRVGSLTRMYMASLIPLSNLTETIRQENGSIKMKIFRKPTDADQYLNFVNNHPLNHKCSIIGNLNHRTESIISDLNGRKDELKHIKTDLNTCRYPYWAIIKASNPIHDPK